MTLDGHEVIGSVIEIQNGAYRREKMYLSGWIPGLQNFGHVKYIIGYSGRETEVTVESILPSRTFTIA